MRIARKPRRNVTPAYGPAVLDRQRASDTLAEAEHALRVGDARRAEETYLRALGKLGPFADPCWRSGAATDAHVRAQCHARLAAIAFDDGDYERSLRETAMAATARHQAIEADRCTSDDIRFMITALVHSATVHDRLGAHREALESSAVALEFGRFARTQDHDPATRRSIAAAQRAAARLYAELNQRNPLTADPSDPSDPADPADPVERDRADHVNEAAAPTGVDRPSAAEDTDEAHEADEADGPVIDLTDTTARRQLLATASIDVLGIPDDPIRPAARVTETRPDPTFADLIDLTDTAPEPSGSARETPHEHVSVASSPLDAAAEVDPADFAPLESLPTVATSFEVEPPAEPDLLDEVANAARSAAVPVAQVGSAPHAEVDDLDEEVPVDDRFARPRRQDERRARREDVDRVAARADQAVAGPAAASDPARQPGPRPRPDADERTPVDIDLTRPVVPPVERRQSPPVSGESSAELIGRSRGQALLARVLLGQSDSEAAINAHRAVRTATRARQWAKEDPNATPLVALNLIEALVVRGDVLTSAGHHEVARTDLRRARAIADQLWLACPSPTSALALALVALRSAVLDLADGSALEGSCHLDQARQVIADARALDLLLPGELTRAGDALDGLGTIDPSDEGHRLEVVELGDRLLDRLQALDQDPTALEAPAPSVAVG